MTVGIAQLIRDAVQEQVAAFRIKVHGQALENVHVTGVGDGAHGGRHALGPKVLDG